MAKKLSKQEKMSLIAQKINSEMEEKKVMIEMDIHPETFKNYVTNLRREGRIPKSRKQRQMTCFLRNVKRRLESA